MARKIGKWLVESVGLPSNDSLCHYLAAKLIDEKRHEQSSTIPKVQQGSIRRINRRSEARIDETL